MVNYLVHIPFCRRMPSFAQHSLRADSSLSTDEHVRLSVLAALFHQKSPYTQCPGFPKY